MGKKAPVDPSASGGFLSSVVAAAAFVAVAIGSWRNKPGGGPAPAEDEPLDASSSPSCPPAVLAVLDRWQRRHRPVGFVLAVLRKFGDDRAGSLAALVSYFAFFSVFPLFLALTSVLGMVLEDQPALRDRITGAATDQVPILGPSLAAGELTGSRTAVVIGITVALWSGLKVIDAAQNALNDVWDVPMIGRPSLAKRRLKSLALLGLLGVSLLATVVISTAAGFIPDLPGQGRLAIYIASIVVNSGVFLLAFKLLSEADHGWADLVPGSLFAAVGWFTVQVPGAYWIERTIRHSVGTYQNFAAVIGLLTFFFLASQVVIIGAEINVVRARRLWPRSLIAKYGELTPADERAYSAAAEATTRLPSQHVVVGFGRTRRIR